MARMSVNQFRELQRQRGEKPRGKYGNIKTHVDGIAFDSQKEARRYNELKLLEKAGEIDKLTLQKKYLLQPSCKINGQTYRSISYFADFVYYDQTPDKKHCNDPNSRWVVEDVKSPATRKQAVYRLKKRMMAYVHGIEIKEI